MKICYAIVFLAVVSVFADENVSPGEPLLLTPLIDAGKLDEARARSWVAPLLGPEGGSFGGFLTVNRTTKSHLYFWFAPKDGNQNASTPLILWLNGGPGWSSLFGLFNENGPYEMNGTYVQARKHSWSNEYHMLYIDQPVGTGFSFTEDENGYITTQEEVGEHLYEALVQFYQLFPQLRDQEFYIAGEDYAGKFIPALGRKIHTANIGSKTRNVPLTGMMIGNGFSDPENMLQHAEYLYELALIDRVARDRLKSIEEQIKFHIRSEEWLLAANQFGILFHEIMRTMNTTSVVDYTRDNLSLDPSFIKFLTQNQTRERIHVGGLEYNMLSDRVAKGLVNDILKTVRPWIEELLEHYPMLFYSGQFDITFPYSFTVNFLEKAHWSGASEYAEAKRQIWREEDAVAGYYKTAGNLVEVLVHDAGRLVPAYQPKNILALIKMFFEKKF